MDSRISSSQSKTWSFELGVWNVHPHGVRTHRSVDLDGAECEQAEPGLGDKGYPELLPRRTYGADGGMRCKVFQPNSDLIKRETSGSCVNWSLSSVALAALPALRASHPRAPRELGHSKVWPGACYRRRLFSSCAKSASYCVCGGAAAAPGGPVRGLYLQLSRVRE